MTPEQEIEVAAKLHYSFLPDDLNNQYLDIATLCLPLGKIGGDYCSITHIDDDTTIVGICDVTGHNIFSALLAARINTYMVSHAKQYLGPCELIEGLNEYLCKHISKTGTYTSFGFLSISRRDNEIIFGGAALPPIIYFNSITQEVETLNSETIFLGAIHPLPVKCEMHKRNISAGDRIIMSTDGVIEAENSERELWGIESVMNILKENFKEGSRELNNKIMKSLYDYSDNKLNDDLTLMSIYFK